MTNQTDELTSLFANLPQEIRDNIVKHFKEIVVNYKENRWEPSELNGAKFSEAIFRLLEWHTNQDKAYTPFGNKTEPFNDKLKQFENKSTFPNSIRFHIPKMLGVIYSLRNDRGIGHIGGDVNPNHMDSVTILSLSKWVMAELIRIFYTVSLSEAQSIVERIVEKEIPIVWKVMDKRRVLNNDLSFEEKTLVLLYSTYPEATKEKDLINWIEHSNPTVYRRILEKLHKDKYLEYDRRKSLISLSPKGIKLVERTINLSL